MNTRRFPRTTQEAFGHPGPAVECFTPSPESRIVGPALIAAVVLLAVLLAIGVIR